MIEFQHVHKTYRVAGREIPALNPTSLTIEDGQVFGLIGHSGAGKSTMLRLINRLEEPSGGKIIVDGEDVTAFNATQLRGFRQQVGMIFQHFNLLANSTVAENIELPMRMAGVPQAQRSARVEELLRLVGLAGRGGAYPAQLSGGQKQRVGIARALVLEPQILLCDEATSVLDPESTQAILDLLRSINQRLGLTIVLITHEMQVIRDLCDRVAVLEQGRIVETGAVWEVFGNPRHAVSRILLSEAAPAAQASTAGKRYLDLHYTGGKGLKPDLAAIGAALGDGVSLFSGSIAPIQGRFLGQLRLAIASATPDDELLRQARLLADRAEWA